jgi:hypothetical protein
MLDGTPAPHHEQTHHPFLGGSLAADPSRTIPRIDTQALYQRDLARIGSILDSMRFSVSNVTSIH